MKRILAFVLTVCIAFSLAACGGKTNDPVGSIPTTAVTSPTTEPTAATVAPTSAPTVVTTEPTSAPVPTEAPASAPTDAPTEAPTEIPTKAPTEAPTKATTIPLTRKPITVVKPTVKPTAAPTTVPTTTPTTAPTDALTTAPTWTLSSTPTAKPTIAPTAAVTVPTAEPTTAAPTTAPTTPPVETPSRRQTIPYEQFESEYGYSYKQICNSFGTAWDSKESLDIPIYYEEEILGVYPFYHLASDTSYTLKIIYDRGGEYGNGVKDQLYRFPTDAIRMREDGTSYLVYDTETDYRLYVFVADVPYLMGYPIVINKNKMLFQDDFKDIQAGDSIEKVAAVDDIMEFYKEVLYDDYYIPIVFENRKKGNNPISSVHYLKDGILRIEYAMPEEGSIVVANIEFFEDYIIPTADGKLTSHKIKDIDLPVS